MEHSLVVMVKAPRIGRAKTRLARDIGYIEAWTFYRNVMCRILRPLACDKRWVTSMAVTPDDTLKQARIWPLNTRRLAQGSGNLGARMGRVMAMMPPGPVVIIGADIPKIQPAHIKDAFHALGSHDAVFGPAKDGGFWLVGLRRRPALKNIFSGVRWSTAQALADTKLNLPANWSVVELEVLTDVDDSCTYFALKQKRV